MLLVWLVGRLQKEAKEKIWRVIVANTTLGDTLVELQLSELTLFMEIKSNSSRSIVQFSIHLGFHTFLIVRCSIFQALGQSTHIPSQANTIISIVFANKTSVKTNKHERYDNEEKQTLSLNVSTKHM